MMRPTLEPDVLHEDTLRRGRSGAKRTGKITGKGTVRKWYEVGQEDERAGREANRVGAGKSGVWG